MNALPWRVGARVPEHIYDGDNLPIVTMPSAELAWLVVAAVNRGELAVEAPAPEQQEREWAAMREDRDQFERRTLVAETELRETASALAEEKAEHQATLGVNAELRECLLECARSERRDFIRRAAVALKTAHWPSGQVLPAEACWREARELWDAKPEDC